MSRVTYSKDRIIMNRLLEVNVLYLCDILCKSAKAILDIDEDKLDDDVKKAVAFCKSKKHPSN